MNSTRAATIIQRAWRAHDERMADLRYDYECELNSNYYDMYYDNEYYDSYSNSK